MEQNECSLDEKKMILAEPRVRVEPKVQWSMQNSRVSLECRYDFIDTRLPIEILETSSDEEEQRNSDPKSQEDQSSIQGEAQFGLRLQWSLEESDQDRTRRKRQDSSTANERYTLSMQSSRLTIERVQRNDSGSHICQVSVPSDLNGGTKHEPPLTGQAKSELRILDSQHSMSSSTNLESKLDFWMFHDNGISVYRLKEDEGQEMELLKEINGHSLVSAQVDGNWNQLTLCGGLNPEQVVICEWSDDAIVINVGGKKSQREDFRAELMNERKTDGNSHKTLVYVGQPNLNRLVVLDAKEFEIVAIINTEPQPRKLHLFQPNKLHLSKWIRRRISPASNGRLAGLNKVSRRAKPAGGDINAIDESSQTNARLRRKRSRRVLNKRHSSFPDAIQFDIWLLCYGQPLVVDPEGGDTSVDGSGNGFPFPKGSENSTGGHVEPFTPRLSPSRDVWPFGWPFRSSAQDKESRLRNRKSVYIVQSTFFPAKFGSPSDSTHRHQAHEDSPSDDEDGDPNLGSSSREPSTNKSSANSVTDFKRSTVITTHHVSIGQTSSMSSVAKFEQQDPELSPFRPIDLIQDLTVPAKPYAVAENPRHKLHFAYVSHYNERRLFRVSMDEYRYNREIDLQNCDPIQLTQTAQGLLVVQCRAPISHQLTGQLVLDELTSSHIEFNANVRAQDAYLSPDNRYLISVFTNQSSISGETTTMGSTNTVVYVQLVTTFGLKFQYEIKTSTLDISQCSFVWRDGYYAAIFVSTNRRDQESEILSLRLADGRLELMARIPGVVGTHQRHKRQLLVAPEYSLAALSTNEGTFIIDLEENRVFQSLRHHQSPPTLLWV